MKIKKLLIKTKDGRNIEIKVERAESFFSKVFGLMLRKKLEQNSGMLFVFDTPERYGIWNMLTLIPLDVIFISKDMKIIGMEKLPVSILPTKTIYPNSAAKYILELNAGFIEVNNLNVEDKIEF